MLDYLKLMATRYLFLFIFNTFKNVLFEVMMVRHDMLQSDMKVVAR